MLYSPDHFKETQAMKIFVTGATGLIGANSALELLAAGHDVRLLVRNKEMAQSFFKDQGYDLDDYEVMVASIFSLLMAFGVLAPAAWAMRSSPMVPSKSSAPKERATLVVSVPIIGQ